ncbi:MAG TPA: ATP-binding protein, partial [Rhodothermales bacterium]|nr:ATP-binding protein [Rhodothermales bacterium]
FTYDAGAPNSLAGEAVWRWYESHDGTIWIAGLDGLTKVTAARGKIAYHQLGISARYPVQAIHEGTGGVLWLGTAAGLVRLDRRTAEIRLYRHDPEDPTSLSHNNVTALLKESSGMLWVGTRSGLNRFDPATEVFTRYRPDPDAPSSLSHAEISRLYRDRSGVLWVGTIGGGLNRFDGETDTFTPFRHNPDNANSLSGNTVSAILENQRGALWVGTREGGLSRLDVTRRTVTRFLSDRSDPRGLPSVTSLYEDASGVLWIGTLGGGLHRFEAGSFAHMTRANSPLPDNHVLGLLGDNQGTLWVATSQGLVAYDPREHSVKTYGLAQGIPAEPFTRGAYYKSPRGELFWGKQDGFVTVDPSRANPHPPRVVLSGFRSVGPAGHTTQHSVGGKMPPSVRLSPTERTFSIDVAGLHYARPQANRYAYRLEPYDPVWREAGRQRTTSYVNVPPGEYIFRARAANPDGVWNDTGASIHVTVLPPWWRTPWAYLFYGLLLAGGIVAVHRLQRSRLLGKERAGARLREEQLKAEAAEERARILKGLDEAKSRFYANVSHEFRTPLTLILGPLEDALRDPTQPLEAQDLVRMRRNARHLRGLIGQLLDLSRLEAGHLELHRAWHDLVAFLQQLVRSFASLAERRHVMLHFESEHESFLASFDAEKLGQVISNLLDNALKFTPEGGRVRLHLRTQAKGIDGEFIEICVRDTGPGIPKADQERIFERFHQVEHAPARTHDGAGIGLALARELVELHGGTLHLESEFGFGSEFVVRLPLTGVAGAQEPLPGDAAELARPPEQGEPTSDSDPAPEADGDTISKVPTVLIVDDNDDVRAYIRSRLAADYHVAEAADGLEGLERTQTLEPDLVIADVMMPRMDGYALCRAIKEDEALGHIPVVLVTARADEASRLEGLGTGADDYLSKPFNSEELLLRTENLITLRRRLRARYESSVLLEPAGVEISSDEAVFLEEVKAVIEEHMGNSAFTVAWLASEVGMSVRQLQRRLKESTDLSPSGLIRMMRLQRAAQLLEQEAGTVAEVAYRVGYASPDAFSRTFQQVYGASPSAYPSHHEN